MTVVVDIGCYSHPDHEGASQDSVHRLIDRYRPDELYGFDPHPDMPDGWFRENGTSYRLTRKAAWTYDGTIGYAEGGLGSRIGSADVKVGCFDLARWIVEQYRPLVVKLDVEGSEYALLEHLHAAGADRVLEVLLVEWHEAPDWEARRDRLLEAIPCPVLEWD